MSDDFDRASDIEQAQRDAALAAVQAAASKKLFRADCVECGDDLEPHRQPYGICVPCKSRQERRAKLFRG
ncbi:hypothetical protein ACTSKR_11470 [Chitinibacteraceae bacterium HSL-7]